VTLVAGFDATAAVTQRAGIGRYSRELLAALVRQSENAEYRILYMARGETIPLPDLGSHVRTTRVPIPDRYTNVFWQRLRVPLPAELILGKLNVFHSPDFTLPPSIAPGIVTVHDLAFEVVPQLCYPSLALYLSRAVPRSVRRAHLVIVPSQSTKRDLIRYYDTPEEKISVIPEAPSMLAADTSTTDKLDIDRPFLLAVGTLEPRKNFERLLEAFAKVRQRRDGLKLLIVGRKGWMYDGIFETQRRLGLDSCVEFAHDVSDGQLAQLYEFAEATIYGSLYEGFGLPAIEALAHGSPLICSAASSLPEVVGTAAALFDPWDVGDIQTTIERVVEDESLRADLRRRGLAQATKFSWDQTAQATLSCYREVAA
jgi:glycosyltransferase involved in cell wall biosynthesis